MQSHNLETRYTAALPANAEVANNADLLVADHTSALFSAHGITGITWNVLDPALPSGYDLQESDEQINQRRFRILERLKRMVEANKGVDVILLQEAGWLGKDFLDEFKAMGWYSAGSADGNILLFNTNYNIENVGGASIVKTRIFGDVSRVSFDLKNKKTVRIMNVQGSHAELPLEHKAEIEKLLALDELVIVAGDFNVRIAPEHSNPQNIITGLVPARFREVTGACNWTDGAFAGGKDLKPKQCSIILLDPQTGQPADVKPPVFESDEQRAQVSRMWPCVKIGVSPHAKFEEQLRIKLSSEGQYKQNPDIHVFSTSNAMNRKGVMIAYTKTEKEFFESLCKAVKGIDVSTMDGDRGVIYLASMSAAQFVEAQEWFFRQMNSQLQGRFSAPAIEFRTAPALSPLCFTSRLLQLQTLLLNLEDDGKSVDACRQIKDELKGLTGSAHPLTGMFSKMILANYYLRFSEYNEQEFKRIEADERQLPACIIRPTHLSLSIALCIELLTTVTPELLVTLSENEQSFLLKNLIQVCQNVRQLVEYTRDDLAKMVRYYDKAMENNDTSKSASLHHKQVTQILEEYDNFDKAFRALLARFPQQEDSNVLFVKALNVKSLHSPGCQLM